MVVVFSRPQRVQFCCIWIPAGHGVQLAICIVSWYTSFALCRFEAFKHVFRPTNSLYRLGSSFGAMAFDPTTLPNRVLGRDCPSLDSAFTFRLCLFQFSG